MIRPAIAMIGIAALSLSLTACGASGNSTSVENSVYISTLDQYSIPYSSPAAAIDAAHAICGELAKGMTGSAIIFTLAADTSYSQTQAGAIVGASVGSYCSQYKDLSQS